MKSAVHPGNAELHDDESVPLRISEASAKYSVLPVPAPRPGSPDYKRTELGLVPDDWEVRPLWQVAQVRSGIAKNSKKEVRNPVSVYYLRVANVQDGFFDLTEMSTIRLGREDMPRYEVLPGDVLMNEGGDLDQLGRGSMWRGEFDPCVHQNHVFVVRCGPHLLPEFLNIWTGTAPARRYFLVAGKQTTNLASINKTALGLLPVLVPKPEEQRAIAEALSDVDGLLGALDALIAKKRAIKQAAMHQLLTGKTRLPGFSGEWETKRLGAVAELHRQGVEPASLGDQIFAHFSLPAFDSGKVPCVELGSAIGSNKFRVPPNAVLVSKLNPRIPRVWIPLEDLPNSVASTEFLVLTPLPGTSRPFLFVLCSSPLFGEKLELAATGTTGSHQRVNPADAMGIAVRMPPQAEEQDAIADALSDIELEIAALERRRDKTRAIKQGMMQQLLTGRVRLVQPTMANAEAATP